jgi:hypothetical protein
MRAADGSLAKASQAHFDVPNALYAFVDGETVRWVDAVDSA